MTIQFITPAGSKLRVSPNAPATQDAVGYQAVTGYEQVALPTSLGEIGPTDNMVTYIPLGDPTVQKAQGSRDFGAQTLPMAYSDEGDAGLDIIEAQHEVRGNITCEVELPDGTLLFYLAKSDGVRYEIGEADSVLGLSTTLHLTSKIVKVAAGS